MRNGNVALLVAIVLNCPVGWLQSAPESIIRDIHFVGNQFFTDEVLQNVIYLQPTEYSVTDQFLLGFADLVLYTPSLPQWFYRIGEQLRTQIIQARQRFYNATVAENDRQTLLQLYGAYGFHNADVTVKLRRDRTNQYTTVVFEIWEGQRAVLDTVVLLGLEPVPKLVRRRIDSLFAPLIRQPMSVPAVIQCAQLAVEILQDNGYLGASFSTPFVSYNTATNADSVTVLFVVGKRYRIADVQIHLDTRGQKPVSKRLIKEQILFSVGQWYSHQAVSQTEKRLRQLGNVFEYVTIDTISTPSWEKDSLVGLRVNLRMRKTESLETSVFYAKYPLEISWDVGGIGEYQHSNIFGAAQQMRLYAKGALRDPIGVFTGTVAPFYEVQVGLGLQQPYLFKLSKYPVAAQGALQVAQQFVTRQLQLQIFQVSIALPMQFNGQKIFQSATFQVDLQRVKPLNFDQAYAAVLSNAETAEDTLKIQRQLFLYALLDSIMQLEQSFFTTSLLALNLTGDTRNHPFFPTAGHYLSVGLEGAGILPDILRGNSHYLRFSIYASIFHRLSSRWVVALKQRLGHIFWLDKQSYVPLDKHFFAGGSNSLRAWATRRLSAQQLDGGATLTQLTDIVGGASIVEGSLEFRFRFARKQEPATWVEAVVDKILGWTIFVDWGNMFNSFLAGPEAYGQVKVLPNIALDAGVGIRIGVTSAPPVRIDLALPLYDPMRVSERWFFQRIDRLPFRWQIAIGEAF